MKRTTHGGDLRIPRRALFFGLAAPFATSAAVLFGDEPWYRDRPEPEQKFTGVLRRRKPDNGPNARGALRYLFHQGSVSHPVYAPAKLEQFDAFLGKHVEITGKLVDMRSEGFGKELWVASIKPSRAP